MSPVTSELHSMSRRQQILTSAETVLKDKGIEGFTMDLVVKHAEIAKGTAYKYFKSKDEILAVISARALEMLLHDFEKGAAKESNYTAKIRSICFSAYRFYVRHKAYWNLISYMERPEFEIDIKDYIRISQELQDFCEDIIETGKSRGEIRTDLPTREGQLVLWASCVGVVQFLESKKRILRNVHNISLEGMISTYADMITKGIS